MPKMNTIKYINIATTNKCNLKCTHCSIWKEQPKKDIPLILIEKILTSNVLDKNADITLTGGEPFLHKSYLKLIKLILQHNPAFLKTISTNGTLTDKILKFADDFKSLLNKSFSLHISLDGIKTHNKQRGKSLNQIKKTIKAIKTLHPKIRLKLKFTITPLNYKDILATYKYANKENIGFKIKLIENAPNYTNKITPADFQFSTSDEKSILKDLSLLYSIYKRKGNLKEAYFIKSSIEFLKKTKNKALCKTPFKRIFVMPEGTIYSCIHFDKIGNIRNEELTDVWQSKQSNSIRKEVAKNGCKSCVSYHGYQ